MTEQELRELYTKVDPHCRETDPYWWRECLRAVKDCVEAPTIQESIKVLDRAGWGMPLECAEVLRGEAVPCEHCGRMGIPPEVNK